MIGTLGEVVVSGGVGGVVFVGTGDVVGIRVVVFVGSGGAGVVFIGIGVVKFVGIGGIGMKSTYTARDQSYFPTSLNRT